MPWKALDGADVVCRSVMAFDLSGRSGAALTTLSYSVMMMVGAAGASRALFSTRYLGDCSWSISSALIMSIAYWHRTATYLLVPQSQVVQSRMDQVDDLAWMDALPDDREEDDCKGSCDDLD